MFQFFRKAGEVVVLKDERAFWNHCDATQRIQVTPSGPLADAEERLDLHAAQELKALLEREVGPEEGPGQVQGQNWDWNDDRRRAVFMLRSAFRPELIGKLQALLIGDLSDFEIILSLFDDWDSEAWGRLLLSANHLVVQRNVAVAYSVAQ